MSGQQPDGTEAFEGRYRLIRPDQPLSREFRDEYWQRAKPIVRKVFRGDERRVDDARKRLEELEQRQPQTIFYHADPFEVAADLAGRKGQAVTPEEKARYQKEVLRLRDRPPPGWLTVSQPQSNPRLSGSIRGIAPTAFHRHGRRRPTFHVFTAARCQCSRPSSPVSASVLPALPVLPASLTPPSARAGTQPAPRRRRPGNHDPTRW